MRAIYYGVMNGDEPTKDELDAVVAASRVGWLLMDPLCAAMRARGLAGPLGIADGPVDVATLAGVLEPEATARVIEGMTAAVHADSVLPIAVQTRPRDGCRRTLEVRFGRVRGPRPSGVAALRDTSPDERRSEELRVTRVMCDGLERLVQGGTWVFDMTTMTLSWSDGLFRIHGLDPGGLHAVGRARARYGPRGGPPHRHADVDARHHRGDERPV